MPDIITLAQQFRNELIAQDGQAIGEMTKRWLTVEQSLSGRVEALAEEIASIQADGGKIPRWKLYELARYQSLLAQTAAELTQYNQWAEGQISQLQADAIELANEHAKALVMETMDGERTAVATWDKLPTGAIENITAIAQAGQPLNQVLQKSYPTAVEGLTNLLINNTAAGINPRETARTAVRDGLSAGLNHILLVARDQQIRNYREMARTRYDESDVIYGYMRLAAKNTRTCVACLALDGSVWATNEVMPLHPQDRCVGEGQLVTTKNGSVPIEDVVEGDMVLTQHGRYRRVLKTMARHYKGEMLRIKYNGNELLVTPEHKIKTQRGWIEARDLTASDILETF